MWSAGCPARVESGVMVRPVHDPLMLGCRCLAYRQQDRLDVAAAAAHPYLVIRRPRQGSAVASPAGAAAKPA